MGAGSPSSRSHRPTCWDWLILQTSSSTAGSSAPFLSASQSSSFLPVSCIYLRDQSAFIFVPRHLVCSAEEKQQRDLDSLCKWNKSKSNLWNQVELNVLTLAARLEGRFSSRLQCNLRTQILFVITTTVSSRPLLKPQHSNKTRSRGPESELCNCFERRRSSHLWKGKHDCKNMFLDYLQIK